MIKQLRVVMDLVEEVQTVEREHPEVPSELLMTTLMNLRMQRSLTLEKIRLQNPCFCHTMTRVGCINRIETWLQWLDSTAIPPSVIDGSEDDRFGLEMLMPIETFIEISQLLLDAMQLQSSFQPTVIENPINWASMFEAAGPVAAKFVADNMVPIRDRVYRMDPAVAANLDEVYISEVIRDYGVILIVYARFRNAFRRPFEREKGAN